MPKTMFNYSLKVGSSTASTHLSNVDNNGGLAMLLGNSIQPLEENHEASTSLAPMMMNPLPFHLYVRIFFSFFNKFYLEI